MGKSTKAAMIQVDPEGEHTGLLVAAWLDPVLAQAIALPGGEPPENLHITLSYCGDATEMSDVQIAKAIAAIANCAQWFGPLTGTLNGLIRFNGSESSGGKDVFCAQVDIPELDDLAEMVEDYLAGADCYESDEHGYTPHVTLTYLASTDDLPMQRMDTYPITISSISVSIGDLRTDIPLSGGSMNMGMAMRSAAKAGARHSGSDSKMIQAIHDHASALGATCASGKSAPQSSNDDDMLIAFGEEIKTYTKDGRGYVEAMGVRFSSAADKDLVGDYFTAKTDFGPHNGNGMATTLNHRVPMYLPNTKSDERAVMKKLAGMKFANPVEAQKTDTGILVRHVLELADEYEKTVFDLASKKKLRWSSGTAPHMVERGPDGEIKSWHIIEWAYTPTAAEPKLPTITPLKAWAAVEQVFGLSFKDPEANHPGDAESQSAVAMTKGLRLLDLLELETV